jgi:predicted dehydrogenase
MGDFTRREFLWRSALATGAAAATPVLPAFALPGRRAGPNDRVRVAVIGVKGRGSAHIGTFLKMNDVEVAAICDIDQNVIKEAMTRIEKANGKKPAYHQDLRKLFEDKSIDAVSVATCNHWHTLAGLWAVQSGKHAYVEKPISHNVWEGRKLVEAAKKYGKIVQHGTQSRSSTGIRAAIEFLHAGKLGAVKVARGLCYKRRDSIGKAKEEPVPAGVDYDIWLGPAPVRPFTKNRFHYNWHWNWDYGNGDIGNQGVHQMDICRWGIQKMELPKSVTCVGGRFGYEDDGQTANTQIGVMDYGDCQVVFEVRGLPTDKYRGSLIGNIFHCAEGDLVIGAGAPTAFDLKGGVIQKFGGGSDDEHFRNFIHAIKENKPESLRAPVLDGHLSAALCHLPNVSHRLGTAKPLTVDEPFGKVEEGNEAYRRFRDHLKENGVKLESTPFIMGRTLALDPKSEKFVGDPEADKLLTRDYRKPFVVPESV